MVKYFITSMDWNVIHTILNLKKKNEINFYLYDNAKINSFILPGFGALHFGTQRMNELHIATEGTAAQPAGMLATRKAPSSSHHSKSLLSLHGYLKLSTIGQDPRWLLFPLLGIAIPFIHSWTKEMVIRFLSLGLSRPTISWYWSLLNVLPNRSHSNASGLQVFYNVNSNLSPIFLRTPSARSPK